MVDIKFDHLDGMNTILTNKKNKPQAETISSNKTAEDIAIHLTSLAELSLSEGLPNEARVLEVKRQLENNTYQLNNDVLAKKLLPYLSKKVG